MKKTIKSVRVLTIKNCTQCPHHKVVADPDPYDWFCDDDCAVICTIKKSRAERHERFGGLRPATVACRPYMTARETTPPPNWCPLSNPTKNSKKRV